MAVTIDRLTNIISVPQTSWVFVSGTFYTHNTEVFRQDLKSIEASEEGMPFTDTHIRNAPVTVAGTTLAQSIEIIPPYQVEYEDLPVSIQLEGSNNNIWSVADGILIRNAAHIIPTNSAGLIVYNSGSGLDAGQDATLTSIKVVADATKVVVDAIKVVVDAIKVVTDWLFRWAKADEEKNVQTNKYYKRDEDTSEILVEKDYAKDVNDNETLTKP